MVMFVLAIVYLVLSYWVATQARNTRAGFIGTLLLSLLITPFVSFIFLCAFSAAELKFVEAHAPQANSPSQPPSA